MVIHNSSPRKLIFLFVLGFWESLHLCSPFPTHCIHDQSFSGPSTGSSCVVSCNETFLQSFVLGPLLDSLDSVPQLSSSLSWYQTPQWMLKLSIPSSAGTQAPRYGWPTIDSVYTNSTSLSSSTNWFLCPYFLIQSIHLSIFPIFKGIISIMYNSHYYLRRLLDPPTPPHFSIRKVTI